MLTNHTIKVLLEQDGYTAYFEEFPWISAGGETEVDAIKLLSVVFEVAKDTFPNEQSQESFSLSPAPSF